MTFYQQLINHDAVLESYGPGSELQSWTITGTDHGVPFNVSHTDRFASSSDIAFESPWDVADAVWALSSMPGVVVEDVVVNGELADDHSIWRLIRLQQRRGGRLVHSQPPAPGHHPGGWDDEPSRPPGRRHQDQDGPPVHVRPDPVARGGRVPLRRRRRVVLVQRGRCRQRRPS